MDRGLPDSKRTRIGASWSDGHQPHQSHRDLPPIYGPPASFLRPTSQGPPHPLDERRHHEPEFGSPVQDPLRNLSVSAQPFNAFGGARDPVVKRDHSAEPMPMQHARPLSTGEVMENHVNPPPPEDSRRQSVPSYDHPMNQSYRPVPVYPQPPQNPPYERPGYEPPSTPGGYREQILSQVAYVGAASQRKKAPRTSQACEACRAAKAKCDDPKPCTSCREKGIKCDWKPPEPKQTDKVQAEMHDTLRLIKHETQLLLQKVDNVETKLTAKTRQLKKIKKVLVKLNPSLQAELPSSDEDEKEVKVEEKSYAGFRRPPLASRQSSTPDQHSFHPDLSYRPESPELQAMQEEEDEDGDGKLLIPTESTIPVGHTTGAAKLLLWPAIDKLVGERLKEDNIKNDFPFIQEKKHGLRLFGRGPGGSPTPVVDATSDDTYSDVSASPAADNLVHGQIGGISPPPMVDVLRAPEHRRGGLGQNGQLELDEPTVRRLVQSYLKHMHIMHPILDPTQLEKLVKNFLRSMPEPVPKRKTTPPLFAVPATAEMPSNKRKRSPAVDSVIIENGVSNPHKQALPQRSIFTAILFFVLALGKICEHKEKIPDVVPDHESTTSSPAVRNGYTSPLQASPVVSPHSSEFPSPQDVSSRASGRRLSGDGTTMVNRISTSLRNLDVIPGLAYACVATDILGNELGENSLHHVHANVLASLYFGQLGRPVRSHSFISNASRTLQIILRLKLDRLKKFRTVPEDPVHLVNVPAKDNPLVLAFWTCLQLESDIVAELDLPHSGILTLEPVMPYPNLSLAEEISTLTPMEATSYQAQLWMRSHLNEIHRKLYTAGMEETYKLPIANAIDRFPVIEELAQIISEKNMIPPTMRWAEHDLPPDDILAARLRAKFHGAEVITYRPFLKMVLNRSPEIGLEDISPKIMNYSRLCIRAMVDSTRAFHGMGEGRLIVTNVWGTAHAQWGNVIVLQAVFQDPLLRPYIEEKLLKFLVWKTLKFLKNVADRASALATDIKILEHVALKTGLLETQDLSSSFSSVRTGSVDTPLY